MTIFARSFARYSGGLSGAPSTLLKVPEPVAQLNRQLAAEERAGARRRVERGIHERLSADATDQTPPSEAEVASGLRRIEQALRTSPLHIGFVCRGKFFEGPAAFFSTGAYLSRTASCGVADQPGPAAPVYGALNISQRGHKGWGNSCLVLKPELLDHALLNSRDTGDPYSMYLSQECTVTHPLPIVEDWSKDSFFGAYWKALASPERAPIPWGDVDMERPVEVKLLIPDGRLRASDIALVCVDDHELNEWAVRERVDPSKRRDALRHFERETGISVVTRQKEGEPFPEEVPSYSAVVADYAAYRSRFEAAAAAGVESASPHYKDSSFAGPARINKNWQRQPCL